MVSFFNGSRMNTLGFDPMGIHRRRLFNIGPYFFYLAGQCPLLTRSTSQMSEVLYLKIKLPGTGLGKINRPLLVGMLDARQNTCNTTPGRRLGVCGGFVSTYRR